MDEDIFDEEEQVPEPEDEEDFTITTDSRDPDRIFWYDMCALNICGIYFPWLERDSGVLLYIYIFFNFQQQTLHVIMQPSMRKYVVTMGGQAKKGWLYIVCF
jgi:hypothetical protein